MFGLSEREVAVKTYSMLKTLLSSDHGINSLMCAWSSGCSLWKLDVGNRHNMEKRLLW